MAIHRSIWANFINICFLVRPIIFCFNTVSERERERWHCQRNVTSRGCACVCLCMHVCVCACSVCWAWSHVCDFVCSCEQENEICMASPVVSFMSEVASIQEILGWHASVQRLASCACYTMYTGLGLAGLGLAGLSGLQSRLHKSLLLQMQKHAKPKLQVCTCCYP